MSKITAAQARELTGLSVQERVDAVYPQIEKAAKQKRRRIHLHDWWANEGYRATPEWKEAVSLLEKDGYKVKFFYEERQFVDMYTIVEW